MPGLCFGTRAEHMVFERELLFAFHSVTAAGN